MDLLCTETVSEVLELNVLSCNPRIERKINRALDDPVILEDRCLEVLLRTEGRFTNICQYLETPETNITSHMRFIVADWMLQVCEEQDCQEEVYSLAMNYLDRFLTICNIHKSQLQLLGSTCLMLASKLREPSARGLPPATLVFYTENSINLEDLMKWELLVLAKLKWEVSVVTPQDFLGQLLSRLPLDNVDYAMVIRHAQAFIAFSARDHVFSIYTPSIICSAAIVEALTGMPWFVHGPSSRLIDLLDRLTKMTKADRDIVRSCWERMHESVNKWMGIIGASIPSTPRHTQQSRDVKDHAGSDNDFAPTCKKGEKQNTSITPTDVRDVHF